MASPKLNSWTVQPFLESSQNVLIAGAGGGFDIFCGLPLYRWLRDRGKEVHLANLSFTPNLEAPWQRIEPGSEPLHYFPEQHLANFLQQPIYAFQNDGPAGVRLGYQAIIERHQPDTLLLIDGGTDILMRGDEADLGTPEEDISSLAAASTCDIANKYVLCLGFGIDHYHGVSHALFLENVAALIRSGGYLGAWSLLEESVEFGLLRDAYHYTAERQRCSIVNSSIISAIEGHFGDHHASQRTRGSELFINPLMGLYWAFRLEAVAQANLYLGLVQDSGSRRELSHLIHQFQDLVRPKRKARPIPC